MGKQLTLVFEGKPRMANDVGPNDDYYVEWLEMERGNIGELILDELQKNDIDLDEYEYGPRKGKMRMKITVEVEIDD